MERLEKWIAVQEMWINLHDILNSLAIEDVRKLKEACEKRIEYEGSDEYERLEELEEGSIGCIFVK